MRRRVSSDDDGSGSGGGGGDDDDDDDDDTMLTKTTNMTTKTTAHRTLFPNARSAAVGSLSPPSANVLKPASVSQVWNGKQ